MSFPIALPPRVVLRPKERILARMAAWCAIILTRTRVGREGRVQRVLAWIARSAPRPSTRREAERAVLAVCTAHLVLGGTLACLPRTVAAQLYCRMRGHSPAVVFGIKPGTAAVHAWVEAEGEPVAEPSDPRRAYTPVLHHTPGVSSDDHGQ